MTDEQTARERLIDKLADSMDRDGATFMLDEAIAEAMTCDHKFVDSSRCIKCGWIPPGEWTLPPGAAAG